MKNIYKIKISFFKKNIYAPGMYGLIYCSEETSLMIQNSYFENITTKGGGSLIFSINNYGSNIILKNNRVLNVNSEFSLIEIENCDTIVFNNNTFINNVGNLLMMKNSKADIISNQIIKNQCYYSQGCVFNLQKFSSLNMSNNKISNISNVNEGVFYIDHSSLLIEKDQISFTSSQYYAGCLYSISSNVKISSFFGVQIENGCFFLENSNLSIFNSRFYQSFSNKTQSSTCFSIICGIDLINLLIDSTIFFGNSNNTYRGGVNFFLILINKNLGDLFKK